MSVCLSLFYISKKPERILDELFLGKNAHVLQSNPSDVRADPVSLLDIGSLSMILYPWPIVHKRTTVEYLMSCELTSTTPEFSISSCSIHNRTLP